MKLLLDHKFKRFWHLDFVKGVVITIENRYAHTNKTVDQEKKLYLELNVEPKPGYWGVWSFSIKSLTSNTTMANANEQHPEMSTLAPAHLQRGGDTRTHW